MDSVFDYIITEKDICDAAIILDTYWMTDKAPEYRHISKDVHALCVGMIDVSLALGLELAWNYHKVKR